MKKATSSIYFLLFFSIAMPTWVNAQDRLQSIQNGISFLGNTKSAIQTHLISMGFHLDNQTRSGDMIDYSKNVDYGKCHFGFAIKNQKVTAISWTENAIFGQNCLSELKELDFSFEALQAEDVKGYACKNYSRNIMVNLFFRTGTNYFTITVGKINDNEPFVKNNSDANTTENSTGNVTPNEYVVIAQKAYFYELHPDYSSRRKAYLVEGENIKALKEKDLFVYCEFTNATTRKTTKGWIGKDCLDIPNENIKITKLPSQSLYYPFLKLDGEYTQEVKFFDKPIIISLLKKLLKNDYPRFVREFLSSSAGTQIAVRNKVVLVDTFIPHAGPDNRMLLFIDLASGDSFLYWDDSNGNVNYYGKMPVSSNIIYVMKQQLNNNEQYQIDSDKSIMKNIIERTSSQQ